MTTGSGGFSSGIGSPCLGLGCAGDSFSLLGQGLAPIRTRDSLKVRLRGERTVAGSDPRSPKGFWRDTRAKIWGRSRPQKVFSRVRITGVVQGLFLSLQVLAGAGSGTRSGIIGGKSVST